MELLHCSGMFLFFTPQGKSFTRIFFASSEISGVIPSSPGAFPSSWILLPLPLLLEGHVVHPSWFLPLRRYYRCSCTISCRSPNSLYDKRTV
ncbi:hypothetical protein FKM82_008645 [Ascaphus truei]